MFIFLTGKTHFAGVDFKEFRERVGDKTGVTAIFQNTHEDVFTLTVRLKTQIFNHHEIFRIGF
ncbi:hypothetical protein D3C80_1811410 [compost metagenome]